jgi:predicted transcriptional regulator
MNKMYQITAESQQNLLKNQENFKKLLNKLSKGNIRVLDLLLNMGLKYGVVRPSQTFMADKVNLRRETVNRIIKHLYSLGLITKSPQNEKIDGCTCEYQVPSWITKKLCEKFGDILKSFNYSHVKYLCSRTDQFIKNKKVTLYNYINNILLYYNPRILVPRIRECINGDYNNSNRKGFSMQNMDNVVTTEKIDEIDQLLHLTLHGKIKLRAFEDKALQAGLNAVMMASGPLTNPFDFMVSKAIEYSLANRIPVSWKRYYNLRDAYKINSTDRIFMVKPKSGENARYSNKKKTEPRMYSPEREKFSEASNRKQKDYEERQAKVDQNYIDEIKEQVRLGRIDEKTAINRIEMTLARKITYQEL